MTANSDEPMGNMASDPLGGLSPAELLRQGAAEDTMAGDGRRSFEPPSIEEMAEVFPQFEVLELVGKGGMGAVYRVRQKELDRVVALKVLPPGIGETEGFAERFAREAKALAKLNHPGIVTIHEFGRSGDWYFIVMEYVDGVNLRQLLRNGRVEAREALAIVPEICDALQFAHDQGIVHRDIKPENILLDRRGRVKVADFGLAKLMGVEEEMTGALAAEPMVTEAGKVMGTPEYMAPEQRRSPGQVDHRADIYALGVVFYQMLTGELPEREIEPPSRKVKIDVRLDEVVLRALEEKPEMRFQQAGVMKTRVEEAGGDAPVARMHGRWDLDYRSKKEWFGMPLLHVTSGIDPATGRERVAKGIVAIGGRARGVVAFGGTATGGLAFGGVAAGVVACGGVAVGVLSYGGLALALLAALGGAAAGWVAMGGGAFGVYSFGGSAGGVHAFDGETKDEAAVNFFTPWAQELLGNIWLINLLVMAVMFGVAFGVPLWVVWRRNKGGVKWVMAMGGLFGVIIAAALWSGKGWDVWETDRKEAVSANASLAPSVSTAERYVELELEVVEARGKYLEGDSRRLEAEAGLESFLKEHPDFPNRESRELVARRKLLLLEQSGELSQQYGPGHPEVVALGAKLEVLNRLPEKGMRQILREVEEVVVTSDLPEENQLQIRKVLPDDSSAEKLLHEIGTDQTDELRVSREVVVWDQLVEKASLSMGGGDPMLNIRLNEVGAGRLARATKGAKGDMRLAIVIHGKVVVAPVIQMELGRNLQISGIKSREEALELIRGFPSWEYQVKLVEAYLWLMKIDREDYDASYGDLADLSRGMTSLPQWQAMMSGFRTPLGRVVSRDVKEVQDVESLPGLPDREYRMVMFDTVFENKKEAVETVSLVKEEGVWKPAGYFIR